MKYYIILLALCSCVIGEEVKLTDIFGNVNKATKKRKLIDMMRDTQVKEFLDRPIFSIDASCGDFLGEKVGTEEDENGEEEPEPTCKKVFVIGSFNGHYTIERHIEELLEFKKGLLPRETLDDDDEIREDVEIPNFIKTIDQSIVNEVISGIKTNENPETLTTVNADGSIQLVPNNLVKILEFMAYAKKGDNGFQGEIYRSNSKAGNKPVQPNDVNDVLIYNGFKITGELAFEFQQILPSDGNINPIAFASVIQSFLQENILRYSKQQQQDMGRAITNLQQNPQTALDKLKTPVPALQPLFTDICNATTIKYEGGNFTRDKYIGIGDNDENEANGDFGYKGAGFFRDKPQLRQKIFAVNTKGELQGSFQDPSPGNDVFNFSELGIETRSEASLNVEGNDWSVLSSCNPDKGLTGQVITISGQRYCVNRAMNWSPIIVDLDQNMVADVNGYNWEPHTRFNKQRAAMFDISGNGIKEYIEWLGPNDGLLVIPNEDGSVTSAHNLFGTAGGYAHGYEKLATLDKDQNKWVEGNELAGLHIWQDKNGNAVVDDGEMQSVQQWGIEKFYTENYRYLSICYIKGQAVVTWDWWPSGYQLAPFGN